MNLIIIGKSCSGKTTAREYIERKYHFVGYEASKEFKELIKESNISNPEEIFDKYGKDIVAKRLLDTFSENQDFVISGFRTPEEINYVKERFPVSIISLYCSDQNAFQRSQIRGRTDNKSVFEEFYQKKICGDYALGLAKSILEHSNHIINNDSLKIESIKQLENNLDNIIRRGGSI